MPLWLDALPAEGEMVGRLRATDWAATSLGPIEEWPETLRVAVTMAMASRFPMLVAWGPDLVQIYGDAYLPIYGGKHPQIGCRIRDTWAEIWDVVGPMLHGVLDTGVATWAEDQELFIDRLGFPEDTYFTFSYSPIYDAEGHPAGVLAAAMETTQQVVGARRAAAAGAISTGTAASREDAAQQTLDTLAAHPDDLPFTAIYLPRPEGYELAAARGISGPGLPRRLGSDDRPWLLPGPEPTPLVVGLPDHVVIEPHSLSGAPVRQAVTIGLGRHGVLVCGLSPSRRVDDAHLAFLSFLASRVEAALAAGEAFADARARAEERLALTRATIEREAAERSLRAAERFRFAGRAANVGAWTLDLVTGEADVDENVELMFAVPRGSLASLADVMACVDPDDRGRVEAALGLAASEGGEYLVDFGVIHPDGTRRVFQARGTTTPGADGRPRLLQGGLWDATELLEAQAATRESEEQLRAALEAATWGSAIIEPDGRITRVNRALCDLLGREHEEILGLRFADLVHPGDDPALGAAADSHAIRELRLVGPRGAITWVSLSTAPVMASDGTVLHHVVHLHDVTERKRFEAELQQLADHDALTGLLNRRRFGEELQHALAQASRYGHHGAVVMIDLDGLKQVNDTLGHAVGDGLLVAVADILRERLRESDTCARLGGDEFAVILPEADEPAALALASDLLTRLSQSAPLASAQSLTTVTASMGIAPFGGPDRDRTGEEVMTEADIALYEAKDAGRGRVRVFAPSAHAPVPMRRERWPDRIRAALDEDRFVLHGQPIRSLKGDPIARKELLLRMVSEDGELLVPSAFLLAAERSTLIQAIDRWVVRRAVAHLAAHQRAGLPVSFSVNLSAKSMTDPEMAGFVREEIARAGADGSGLVFEITETAAVVNVSRARTFARSLVASGCELALDDFGAGFTSFHYLKHLDFDYVKIDGAFIRDLPASRTSQSLVQALADMAHNLGKRTIAEYVGDEETVQWLREHGVDFVQGYHVGRPAPLVEPRGPGPGPGAAVLPAPQAPPGRPEAEPQNSAGSVAGGSSPRCA